MRRPFIALSSLLGAWLTTLPAGSRAAAASNASRAPGDGAELAFDSPAGQAAPEEPCLAQMLCGMKRASRRTRHAWSPEQCRTIARAVLDSAARHDLPPALLVAVMVNESDLDERAAPISRSRGKVARDSGLMGVRCVLGARGRCTNAFVKGLPWKQVMDPVTNIELGARYLAHYRDGAGRSRIKIRVRDAEGGPRLAEKDVRCRHRDHAYWAHYNHGTRYNGRGPARHYPRHVGVLYEHVARTLGAPSWELASMQAVSRRLTISLRTEERLLGPRYVAWGERIRAAGALCGATLALAGAPGAAAEPL